MAWKLPPRVDYIDHLYACAGDAVQDDVVRMGNDFARTRDTQTWLEKIGMLRGMNQVLLYSLIEPFSSELVAFTDVRQDFQQIGISGGLPFNRQHAQLFSGPAMHAP